MINQYAYLHWTIRHDSKIKPSRREKVIDILVENGITSYTTFVTHTIPTEGLTNNEIMELNRIRKQYLSITDSQRKAARALFIKLGWYTEPHEQTRIFNLLDANKISSERILFATSDEKLRSIKGIGPKSMMVLAAVKDDFMRTHTTTEFTGTSLESSCAQPMLIPLAAL